MNRVSPPRDPQGKGGVVFNIFFLSFSTVRQQVFLRLIDRVFNRFSSGLSTGFQQVFIRLTDRVFNRFSTDFRQFSTVLRLRVHEPTGPAMEPKASRSPSDRPWRQFGRLGGLCQLERAYGRMLAGLVGLGGLLRRLYGGLWTVLAGSGTEKIAQIACAAHEFMLSACQLGQQNFVRWSIPQPSILLPSHILPSVSSIRALLWTPFPCIACAEHVHMRRTCA